MPMILRLNPFRFLFLCSVLLIGLGGCSARKKAIDELLKLNYLQDNSNKYIEIYKVSLPKVKNPSQWETEIYFPVKKKVIKPTIVNPIEIQTNTESNSLENIE